MSYIRPLLVCLLVLLPLAMRAEAPPSQPLKLLTIGNSFSGNAMSYFPSLAKAAGRPYVIFQASPGGCTLERHANALRAAEKNPEAPEGKLYSSAFMPSRGDAKNKRYSLPDVLKAEPWDVVTIQQASAQSFKPETFEPFASEIIAAIHKYAPGARILVHQTWAYREDWPEYKDGFTQQKMYDQLTAAYEKLAKDHNLQIIPAGLAMQLARATDRWHFKYPDPNFDYKNAAQDTVPVEEGSLNAGWVWWKSPFGDVTKLVLDGKHCNSYGSLLVGSVFYEVLFGEDVRKNPFVPDKISPADAAALKELAHQAVASNKVPKS